MAKCVLIAFMCVGVLWTAGHKLCAGQIKARKRISYSGALIGNTYGSGDNRTRDSRGEMLVVGVEALAGEEVYVQAHLYFVPSQIGGEQHDISRYSPVPAAEKKYRSSSLKAATSSTRFRAESNSTFTASVFFPFAAILFGDGGLGNGTYEMRYRLRVWIDDDLADDFFVEKAHWLSVKNVEREYIYRLAPPSGPDVLEFTLEGADEPN